MAGLNEQLGALRGTFNDAVSNVSTSATYQRIQNKVVNTLDTAQEAYKNGAGIGQLRDALHGYMHSRLDVRALQDAGFGAVGEKLKQKRSAAKASLFNMTKPMRGQLMFGLRESAKSALVADPDMCDCVKRNLESLIDLFWDDLVLYLETTVDDARDQVAGQVSYDVEKLGELGDKPTICSPPWFRAFVLYHFLPYDRSIFGQIKDPVFWVLTIISLLTFGGIRVVFFAMILMFIIMGSPADEYQLTCFILSFKGTQFLSSGVCMATYASVQYYRCVHLDGTHTCDTEGPGATQDLTTGAIDIVGSCVLVWIAFFFLPCSVKSAGDRDFRPEDGVAIEAETTRTCCGSSYDNSRGGRLAKLLNYDLCCFLMSLALLGFMSYVNATEEGAGGEPLEKEVVTQMQDWIFKAAVFFTRVFYSFLALPFLFFNLPVLNGILTHTTFTGYNRQGLCVPFVMRPVEETPAASG